MSISGLILTRFPGSELETVRKTLDQIGPDSDEGEYLADISYDPSPAFDDLWDHFFWIFKALARIDPQFSCLPRVFEGTFEQHGDGAYGPFGLLTPAHVAQVDMALDAIEPRHWARVREFGVTDSDCCLRNPSQLPDGLPEFANFARDWKVLANNGDGIWTSWF